MRLMKRLLVCGFAALAAVPARAASDAERPEARVVAALEADGFRVVEIETTWLRRRVIVARSNSEVREVVMDPRSGVILRDYRESLEDDEDNWLERLLRVYEDDDSADEESADEDEDRGGGGEDG